MQSSLYVALSAQVNLERLLDTIANNVANANTAGFRADEIKFEAILSQHTPEPVAFSGRGEPYISTRPGAFVETGNPLDVAVGGNVFFAMATPKGTVYTRDGRFTLSANGDLITQNGYAVLDPGGAPIQLNPNAGPLTIAPDGVIEQQGVRVGVIGLFEFDPRAKLTRHDNSGVIPSLPALPVQDVSTVKVRQGYVEQSNVDPVSEISRLVYVQRAFDAVSVTLGKTEAALQEAIVTLGSANSA